MSPEDLARLFGELRSRTESFLVGLARGQFAQPREPQLDELGTAALAEEAERGFPAREWPELNSELIRAARLYEERGLGVLVVGRHSRKTRFRLDPTLALETVIEAARQVLAGPLHPETGGLPLPRPTEYRNWQFPLRRDYTLTLRLPDDVTTAEAERLATFVRSLPLTSS